MRLESIGGGLAVAQTADFRFGTDAVLLAAFGECRKAGERVCDLGTGCGILPFLLQNRAHPPAYICGVDIQAEAIALCHAANEKNNCENMTFLQADWCHPERIAPPSSFDRVLCNPPYFEGGRVNDSQARTIARHAKETTLFEVCACARYLLKYGGKLCMCHRPDHLATLFAAMRDNGLEPKCLQMVQSAAAAPVQLVLVQAIKGGKAGLQIPPAWLLDHPQTHDMIYGMYKNNQNKQFGVCYATNDQRKIDFGGYPDRQFVGCLSSRIGSAGSGGFYCGRGYAGDRSSSQSFRYQKTAYQLSRAQ